VQQPEFFAFAEADPTIPIIIMTKIIGKNGKMLSNLNGPNPKRKYTPNPTKITKPIIEPMIELFLDIVVW
jgi:hypothetical protein